MDSRDWIALATAVVALVLATYSAIGIRLIHRRQRKLTLLSGLEEWAMDFTLLDGGIKINYSD